MNFNEVKYSFVEFLKQTGRSQGTVENYSTYVLQFQDFLGGKEISKAKQNDLYKFKKWMEKKFKNSTIQTKIAALRVFYGFLQRNYHIKNDLIFPRVKMDLKNGRDIDLLTAAEYKNIITCAEEEKDLRFITIAKLMLFTGMRVSEALQLQTDDVGNDVLRVIGKGGIKRNVYLTHPEVTKTLATYLTVRNQPYASNTKLLFTSERGPLSRQAFHNDMKKYANSAGIPKEKAHAHVFRHLFVKNCLKSGISLEDTASLVGHRDIQSTRYYLEKEKREYGDLARIIQFQDDKDEE